MGSVALAGVNTTFHQANIGAGLHSLFCSELSFSDTTEFKVPKLARHSSACLWCQHSGRLGIGGVQVQAQPRQLSKSLSQSKIKRTEKVAREWSSLGFIPSSKTVCGQILLTVYKWHKLVDSFASDVRLLWSCKEQLPNQGNRTAFYPSLPRTAPWCSHFVWSFPKTQVFIHNYRFKTIARIKKKWN